MNKQGECISELAGESTCTHTVGSQECEKCIHYIRSSTQILGVDSE